MTSTEGHTEFQAARAYGPIVILASVRDMRRNQE